MMKSAMGGGVLKTACAPMAALIPGSLSTTSAWVELPGYPFGHRAGHAIHRGARVERPDHAQRPRRKAPAGCGRGAAPRTGTGDLHGCAQQKALAAHGLLVRGAASNPARAPKAPRGCCTSISP